METTRQYASQILMECGCVPHPDAVASIGIHSRADKPAIKSMQSPCSSVLGLGMNKDPTARWSQGSHCETFLELCTKLLALNVGQLTGGKPIGSIVS
jgi:hypothetical protein